MDPEEEKIVKILKVRKSPHISPQKVNAYLAETHLRTGVPREKLIQTILDVTSEKNYANVYPEIWSICSTNIGREIMLDAYVSGCQWHSRLNELIPPKSRDATRFCSYNIHYFSWPDVTELKDSQRSNLEGILEVVDKIQPDILGLQEALLPYLDGDESKIDHTPSKKHAGYQNSLQPNSSTKISDIPPNRRSIRSEDQWELEDIFLEFENRDYGYRSQCMGSSTHSRSRTYFGNILLSKNIIERAEGLPLAPAVVRGTEYGRCATFGYFESGVVVCTLHLDVFDVTGKVRSEEIRQVLSYLDRNAAGKPTVLMGDLNSLKRTDYTPEEIEWLTKNNQGNSLDFQVTDILEEEGFTEVFGQGMFKYSVWSARRIDFIFTRNILPSQIMATGVMYTPTSDHLPIFVDIAL